MGRARVALVGCGEVGLLAAGFAARHGHELVAAVNRGGAKVGRDVGELVGGDPLGVVVEADLEVALRRARPDIALIAVADYADEMLPIWLGCMRAGVNAICAGSEASYLQLASPAAADAVDCEAKARGVTFLGGGNQDLLMIRSGTMLLGACAEASLLKHERLIDADGFGRRTAEIICIDTEPFAEEEHRGLPTIGVRPALYEIFAHQIAADLGLTVVDAVRRRRPCLADAALWSSSLEREVAPGRMIGFREEIYISTTEGISISFEGESRLLQPGERERVRWSVDGLPGITATLHPGPAKVTTAAQMANRIPDVLEAPPGYLRVDQLPSVALDSKRSRGWRHI